MKENIKTILVSVLFIVTCLCISVLDRMDRASDVFPDDKTLIRLYGEAHGAKVYYDIEYQLWKENYDRGSRSLFLELPYYSAEFLNLWMKEDNDELLDQWFSEISDTLSGNEYYREFLTELRTGCPETVFYGTDVGHQAETTGARYLQYLEAHGLKDTENYSLAEECIRQGREFYESDTQGNGISPIREAYMTENFKAAYERCTDEKIMGIYGSYHTDLNNPERMAGKLKDVYGDRISSVKVSSIPFEKEEQNPYRMGFCVTGLIFLILLMVPNLFWAKGRQPEGYAEAEQKENKILLVFERTGQVLATTSLLVFPALNPLIKRLPEGVFFKWNLMYLVIAFLLMILYEGYWIRYFRSKKTMKDMYASFAGVPLAGAVLPVLALLLMGMYSRNWIVIAAAVILGIGHIGIHYMHWKELNT